MQEVLVLLSVKPTSYHPMTQRRLKVLISAYSCAPDRGSEHEIGWQWVKHLAENHDLTVITRTKNYNAIEQAMNYNQWHNHPRFVYHEAGKTALFLRNQLHAIRFYYYFWQWSARSLVSKLLSEAQFDLLHHVTFSSCRYPTAIWGHKIPCVWGPVGGLESVPSSLIYWRQPKAMIYESLRTIDNFLQKQSVRGLQSRAKDSTVILACTHETQQAFANLGVQASLMSSAGATSDLLRNRQFTVRKGPLRLIYAGRMIALKGIDLAIEALKLAQTDVRVTLIGQGDFLERLKALAIKCGVNGLVEFREQLPRNLLLDEYLNHDACLFPSQHDTGGFTVIEAMACGLPVICLDSGGPRLMVQQGCGIRIPMDERSVIIQNLATAIRNYGDNRKMVIKHGMKAQEVIRRDFLWNKKAQAMNKIYTTALAKP